MFPGKSQFTFSFLCGYCLPGLFLLTDLIKQMLFGLCCLKCFENVIMWHLFPSLRSFDKGNSCGALCNTKRVNEKQKKIAKAKYFLEKNLISNGKFFAVSYLFIPFSC